MTKGPVQAAGVVVGADSTESFALGILGGGLLRVPSAADREVAPNKSFSHKAEMLERFVLVHGVLGER